MLTDATNTAFNNGKDVAALKFVASKFCCKDFRAGQQSTTFWTEWRISRAWSMASYWRLASKIACFQSGVSTTGQS